MYAISKQITPSIIKESSFISQWRHFVTSTCYYKRKKEGNNPIKSTAAMRVNVAKTIGAVAKEKDAMSVFKPVLVKPNPDDLNFGEEIAGKINKQALLKELNLFYNHPEIRQLCKEH